MSLDIIHSDEQKEKRMKKKPHKVLETNGIPSSRTVYGILEPHKESE